jgi:monovalent cation:H+ antiporter-2, CPA2 family
MLLSVQMPLLFDLTIVLGVSILVIIILHYLRLPTIIGFLISGILVGPHGLSLIKADHEVEMLAEIGVILLLFSIGIEFSIGKLMKIRKAVFLGGSIQVFTTIIIFAIMAYYYSYDYPPIAIFIGFLFALSSTAIVLKLLQITNEIGTAYGQVILAILIFQDIAVVPMMLSIPILIGDTESLGMDLLVLGGKIVMVMVCLVVATKYVVPYIFKLVVRTKSKELFITFTLVMCFAVAAGTSVAGLSLALGAFLAGLIISESKYSHEAAGYILPFKEIFTSIFFISVGMLLDLNFLLEQWVEIVILTGVVLVVKALIGGAAAAALRVPFRTILMVAFAICQVGEFSLVLAKQGMDMGILPIEVYQYFLAVAIITMILTPILLKYSRHITMLIILKTPVPASWRRKWILNNSKGLAILSGEEKKYKDHMIIVGFGIIGKKLADGAKKAELPYVIIESSAQIAKDDDGYNVLYGDASNEEVLEYANIKKARVVALTNVDLETNILVAHKVREHNPDLLIVGRTQLSSEIAALEKAGVDEVVADENETSFEIFMHAMEEYRMDKNSIIRLAREA